MGILYDFLRGLCLDFCSVLETFFDDDDDDDDILK